MGLIWAMKGTDMPNYRFLWKPEILWSLFVAAIVAAAVGRAVLAALMARFGPGGFGSGPKPEASE